VEILKPRFSPSLIYLAFTKMDAESTQYGVASPMGEGTAELTLKGVIGFNGMLSIFMVSSLSSYSFCA